MKFYWDTMGEIQLHIGTKVYQRWIYQETPKWARLLPTERYHFSYSRKTRRFHFIDMLNVKQ